MCLIQQPPPRWYNIGKASHIGRASRSGGEVSVQITTISVACSNKFASYLESYPSSYFHLLVPAGRYFSSHSHCHLCSSKKGKLQFLAWLLYATS